MNLLLLLSALLSALSGTGGARAAQVPTTLSSAVVATAVKATAEVRRQVAARPIQAIAGPAHAVVLALPVFALSDSVPAFASRRRE
ncbi:hypothetical protein [Sphingomonas pruni]|uniref:hypothetical protein n=1 Tax=Sphingomonas pruni TaxID=40683 RepID=UPI000832651F|nr:hypothetical protein [Sphingomonas pruni]